RHTRSYGDWSSDVCSSDLLDTGAFERDDGIVLDIQEVGGLQVGVAIFHARIQGRCVDLHFHRGARRVSLVKHDGAVDVLEVALRSEERRVGKECGWR